MQPEQPANTKSHALYFVAIVVPEPVGGAIMKIKQEFAEIYNSKKPLNSPPHITLIQPFYFKDDEIDAIVKNLKAFSSTQKKFGIKLFGFGAFPPKTIFVDVKPNEDLQILNNVLHAIVATDLNFLTPYLPGQFTPHVTVGNRDLSKGNFKKAWEVFEHRQFEKVFEVNRLVLLRHNGNHWETFCEFPFNIAAS